MNNNVLLLVAGLAATAGSTNAQTTAGTLTKDQLAGQLNAITTMVPFLTISPDSRSAGMGDAGVAISPDANSIHWGIAKMAFMDVKKPSGVSLSYAPWLRDLVPDVQFSYLSGYGRINKNSVMAGSLRYFTLGEIQFTDNVGNPLDKFNPNEIALDLGYSTKITENFSVGVALRYIRSNISGIRVFNNVRTKPGNSGAGDLSFFYTKDIKISGDDYKLNLGGLIQNLGAKMTYTDKTQRDFIPTNLKIGAALTKDIDAHNSITGTVDINKLLVPTPNPERDSSGNITGPGTTRDIGVISGLFSSFSDAPGGLSEEMKEYNYSIGVEYWYDKQFALRTGYFHEPTTKGNRKYLTFGLGIRYNVFGLDVAYLVPFQQRHPLQNQLRFSLLFDFAAFKSDGAEN